MIVVYGASTMEGNARRATIPGGCGNPEHALQLLPVSPNKSGSFRCMECNRLDGGPVYRCAPCDYDLCVRCESPAQAVIRCSGNPDHTLEFLARPPYVQGILECNLCLKPGSAGVYHCKECQFDAHQACAEIAKEVQYFAHPHPLKRLREFPYRQQTATCDACLESLTGSRWVYKCSQGCNYDVHGLCAKHPVRLHHPAHERHALTLQEPAEPGSVCEGCKYPVRGFSYKCSPCGYKLHPMCAILPSAPIHSGESPEHRLQLTYKPRNGMYILCVACGERGYSWAYTCNTCDCNLHIPCAMDHLVAR